MTDNLIDSVVQMLDGPDLSTAAASSPAIRGSLQLMLDQVNDELATLAPILEQPGAPDRAQLAAVIDGRRAIVERLHALLDT